MGAPPLYRPFEKYSDPLQYPLSQTTNHTYQMLIILPSYN